MEFINSRLFRDSDVRARFQPRVIRECRRRRPGSQTSRSHPYSGIHGRDPQPHRYWRSFSLALPPRARVVLHTYMLRHDALLDLTADSIWIGHCHVHPHTTTWCLVCTCMCVYMYVLPVPVMTSKSKSSRENVYFFTEAFRMLLDLQSVIIKEILFHKLLIQHCIDVEI